MRRKTLIVVLALMLMVSETVGLQIGNVNLLGNVKEVKAATYGDYEYGLLPGGTTVSINRYNGTETTLTIPETIDGKKVTLIGDYAFWKCREITSITIPSSVTRINDHAFSNCIGLTSITIPSNVNIIEEYAFSECSELTSITISSCVESIDWSAFAYCKKLQSITVSKENQNYCDQDGVLFNKKKTELIRVPEGLSEAYKIPSGVKTIGVGAFYECIGLTSITIPSSVETIGVSAFNGCSELTSIKIPSKVKNLDYHTFASCSKLTSIKIPSSVTSIEEAFAGCRRLTVYCKTNSYAHKYAKKNKIKYKLSK